ncbi:MAG: SAM-dependent methyltransferase [Sandaracinaceae bacterium]|nr:SAM-dependent methyltransferase [Sandaracinaceae bacterium]
MLSDSPSRTAMLVAAYRARASEAPEPICHDPFARALAGDEGFAFAREVDASAPNMELWIAVRTAYLDALVTAESETLRQVVILGAGFDSRAKRLARPGVRFFEVDAPASLAERQRRLALLPDYGDHAAAVSCDFEREDFVERLASVGFRPDEPALIVWEGVSYYLSEPAVRATLARVAQALHPETVIVFDHVGKRFIAGVTSSEEDAATKSHLGAAGEPMIWGIDHALPLLFELGYRDVRQDTFDEACLRFTGTYDRERKFRFQHLVRARVARGVPERGR